MSSLFTTIRKALQTAAQGVMTSDQVVLGNLDLSRLPKWLSDLKTTGPWLLISSESVDANGYDMNGEFMLDGLLFFAKPQNASYDFVDISDLAGELQVAWMTYSPFTKGGVLGPFRMKRNRPMSRTDLAPNVWCIVINFTFKCVSDGVA